MAVRFFMLQSHYSSTLDFSNEALSAAEKGYRKLVNSLTIVKKLSHPGNATAINTSTEAELNVLAEDLYKMMSDDFNTAKTLAVLFEMSSRINDLKSGNISFNHIGAETFTLFKTNYIAFMEDVLGLKEEAEHNHDLINGIIRVLIDLRKKARLDKNYALSDKIRDELKTIGVHLKDGKDGDIDFEIE
jgi:cysteinyl-tRNA synthetase